MKRLRNDLLCVLLGAGFGLLVGGAVMLFNWLLGLL